MGIHLDIDTIELCLEDDLPGLLGNFQVMGIDTTDGTGVNIGGQTLQLPDNPTIILSQNRNGLTQDEKTYQNSFQCRLLFRLFANIGQNTAIDVEHVTIDGIRGM